MQKHIKINCWVIKNKGEGDKGERDKGEGNKGESGAMGAPNRGVLSCYRKIRCASASVS